MTKVYIVQLRGNTKILFRPYIIVANILFLLILVKHYACFDFYSLYGSIIVYPNYIKATKGFAIVGSNNNLLPIM